MAIKHAQSIVHGCIIYNHKPGSCLPCLVLCEGSADRGRQRTFMYMKETHTTAVGWHVYPVKSRPLEEALPKSCPLCVLVPQLTLEVVCLN